MRWLAGKPRSIGNGSTMVVLDWAKRTVLSNRFLGGGRAGFDARGNILIRLGIQALSVDHDRKGKTMTSARRHEIMNYVILEKLIPHGTEWKLVGPGYELLDMCFIDTFDTIR